MRPARRTCGSLVVLALGLAACATPPPAARPPAPAATPTLRVAPGSVDGRRWLAPDAARALAAGAGSLAVVAADAMAEGERVGAFVEIPEAACALAFTRGSPGVGDVDLFAYDDDGSAFATDESPERDAAILVCPPHPRRLYVVARVMTGSGIVGVGVQSVPREAADAVATMMGVRGRPGQDTGRLDSWPGLEARVRARRDGLGGRWEDVRRVALPVSPRAPTRISATLDPGRCLDVLVVPSDEVVSLEVTVEDDGARTVARARDRGKDRSLLVCSAAAARPTPLHLSIRPRGPQGIVAVVLGRSAPGAEPELSAEARGHVTHVGPAIALDDARARVAAQTAGLGYAAPQILGAGTAKIGARAALGVNLPVGCARIDIIAGKPLSELSAALWDDKGSQLAEARAGASAPLFTCGRGGPARLDLEAMESPGPFTVELRRDKAAPPILVARPLAAARLLGRLSSGGDAVDAAAAAAAVVLSLEEGQRRVVPVSPPPGGCLEVVAALDGGARGLELRLVDGAGEGNITRARHVVSDRVCAAPSGKPGAAELRVLAGKADALVLVRPAPR